MPPNILLIVVDALRADRVYEDNKLTPTLDALRAERFKSCYACVEKTISSLTTIQTGMYPTRHGVVHLGKDVTAREQERIANVKPIQERLQETHTTVGVNTRGRWLGHGYDHDDTYMSRKGKMAELLKTVPTPVETVIRQGYDYLTGVSSDERSETNIGTDWPTQRRAAWITDQLIDRTATINGPWYGFMHYYDTHMGYTAEQEHLDAVADREYDDGEMTISELKAQYPELVDVIDKRLNYNDIKTVGDLKRRYDASVRTVDSHIGRLLQALKRRGAVRNGHYRYRRSCEKTY